MKSYCLLLILNATEVMPLSATNIHELENCINKALYKTFGIGDTSCIVQIWTSLGLSSISNLIEVRKRYLVFKLIDGGNHTVLLKVSYENLFYWAYFSSFLIMCMCVFAINCVFFLFFLVYMYVCIAVYHCGYAAQWGE